MTDPKIIPHRPAPGLCPVNGIRDLIHWRTGRDWSNEFVHGLGQGGGFAFLRFSSADPPRQVYWGIAGPRQHRYLAELLGAGYREIENRSFAFSRARAREALEAGTPPVLGPLDMYHLPFYPGIHQRRHIPIHYLLLVGDDDDRALVLDTGSEGVQTLDGNELRAAWEVNVPGLGKKNRLVVLDLPTELPPDGTLIRTAIADQCRTMLQPPVSMVGVPAMEKVAGEIARWPAELGEETAGKCLRQVREYLNSPPDLEGHHLTAGRDIYCRFLEEAGPMAELDLREPIGGLNRTLGIIPRLAEAIGSRRLDEAAACFSEIAAMETEVWTRLGEIVGSR